MEPALRKIAVELGFRLPAQPGVNGKGPVALVYHGIASGPDRYGVGAEVFENHVRFLKENFDLVRAEELNSPARRSRRIQVLLTFDDGFRNNASIVSPILEKYSAPAIFFVATRHLAPGNYLWFAYLRALEEFYPESGFQFNGEWMNMRPSDRAATVKRLRRHLLSLRPHPGKMYQTIQQALPEMESFTTPEQRAELHQGMTSDQLRRLASNPLFEIGAHTADHPFLTMCDDAEMWWQLEQGKARIEQHSGRPCKLFAYPSDDHDDRVRDACRQIGFSAAFSVHRTSQRVRQFTVPRVGVYYPALPELGFKVRWNGALRKIRQWSGTQQQ